MKLSITCKEATTYIVQQEENKLSLIKKIQLKNHLFICSICKTFYRQNALINSWLKKSLFFVDKKLSAPEKENLIASIEAEEK